MRKAGWEGHPLGLSYSPRVELCSRSKLSGKALQWSRRAIHGEVGILNTRAGQSLDGAGSMESIRPKSSLTAGPNPAPGAAMESFVSVVRFFTSMQNRARS